jgi:hypothetical protein
MLRHWSRGDSRAVAACEARSSREHAIVQGATVPTSAAGYDPAVALLSAAVLFALLVMTTRRLNRSLRVFLPRPKGPVAREADFGLLVPIASVPTRADADMLREVLAGHGIRATVAVAGTSGAMCVLVFPADAERARTVVATR